MPRDPGPPRAPRRPLGGALRAALGDRARRDRGPSPRPRRRGAREPARPRLGGHAEAAGEGRRRACYDRAHAAHIRERGTLVSADTRPLDVGDAAPDFTLKTIGLKEISLRDYRGKNVVLLFYPLDWTPG
ncbi:MAG: hypothetical protein A3E31_08735 [Candidatus Rokubacteria bacterium RIFCSPHIGHO2_12_FULL_73_22]|nr:MAG: hypothetical protein A3D33_02375 [Candidatus Rokubacteria bacterium RIFCSPHIGHO2_02_FULL_73_26]OGK99327.1 MAG: hypothetical protein A3E31_08735 [Candidatus Rokubacteria bacterium RIFCSPHIGHO2_12_FULL_73_22]OGL09301.1 MAG: hypothetical protein A3I14_03945 [Candidatus Rokubacteria bacterium RIFCSPLOWO2_02_FULL_73_56]OGL29146.1 MAG: hypothetical protein A3G44_06115 [Candidatus Rokubacteria bacterium RIFCSPLOWO2_12_FULL_73_47]